MILALFSAFAAVLLVVSALLVVLHKNPVTSALFLVLAFCSLAGIYLLLRRRVRRHGAGDRLRRRDHGAVPVRDHVPELQHDIESGVHDPRCAAASAGSSAPCCSPRAGAGGTRSWAGRARTSEPADRRQGNTQAVGQALYTRYLFPFEITSMVLLVAMVGVIVIARGPWHDPSGRHRGGIAEPRESR